jgi:hypothetical protein
LTNIYILSIYTGSMKRSPARKKDWRLVNVWMDTAEVANIDVAADLADLDRSKFIRKAIREKMGRFPIAPAEAGKGATQ